MNGEEALAVLDKMTDRVELVQKDNTDKFWCYKLRAGSRAEFAFDPNTKTKLVIRLDRPVPAIEGIIDIESLKGKSTSTALSRVFSGGRHVARYKANVQTHDALKSLIDFLAQ
jgi:hypothetical protein